MIYDCFVLNSKAKAIYYIGSQEVLQPLNVVTAATDVGKTTIIVEPGELTGAKRVYKTSNTTPTAVAYGDALTTGWTELTSNGLEITPTSGHTWVQVAELDADNKAIAVGTSVLNIG